MKRFSRYHKLLVACLSFAMVFVSLSSLPITAASSLRKDYEPFVGVEEYTTAFSVGTAEELAALRFPTGKTSYVELTADIDLSGVDFTPLNADLPAPDSEHFQDSRGAAVVFEGNGHTISHLTASVSAPCGLFMYLYRGSVVRNLHFEGVNLTADGWPNSVGAVAGLSDSRVTLFGVTVDGTSSLQAKNGFAGGLIGMIWDETGRAADADGTSISYCINEASVVGRTRVGGLVGSYQSMDSITFRYCINRGAVTHHSDYATTPGGLLGNALACHEGAVAADYTGKAYVFDHCVNAGTLTVDNSSGIYHTGGIVGVMGDDAESTTLTLSHCYDVSIRQQRSGGKVIHGALIGKDLSPSLILKNCAATGEDYTYLIAANDLYEDENAIVSTDASVREVTAAAVSAIEEKIASAGAIPTLAISSESQNLSLRLKLTEPFGLLAITTLSWDGQLLPVAEYDRYADSVGFVFLCSPTAVHAGQLMVEGERVEGVAYQTPTYDQGKKFCAPYDLGGAATLDDSVYFAAYVDIDGCLFLSEVREIRPVDAAKMLAFDDDTVPAAEKENYRTMIEQNESLAVPKSVTVATYNIYHCADITKIDYSLNPSDGYWAFTDTIVNSDNIAEVIYRNGIEICGMEETTAYSLTYGDGDTAQAERIAGKLRELTGETYYWAFAPARIGGYANRGDPNGAFGNSLVSKYPILSTECYGIGSKQYYRCLLRAELDVDGTVVTVLVSHFDNTSSHERMLGVQAVREIKEQITTPTILMGDFNAPPGYETGTYAELKSMYTPTAKTDAEIPYTHPSDNPRTTFDYILHTPDITSTNLHTDTAAFYSDHLPVIATLTLPKKN